MNTCKLKVNQLCSKVGVCLVLVLSVCLIGDNAHAIAKSIAKGIVKEMLEWIGERGEKEILESISKKVGKEAMEELAERTIKEIGEEGAQRLFKELAEQTLRYGDDVLIGARKYGVPQIVNIMRELSEETGKKALKAILNSGDDLLPLVQRYGKEVLEMEAKHPGLAKQVAGQFGTAGIKYLKNCETQDIITLLRRKDILNNLTEDGKRLLCEKMNDKSISKKILEIFSKKNSDVSDLVKWGVVIGSTYIVVDKVGSSEMTRPLPDGRIVKDRISILHSPEITTNPDGSVKVSYDSIATRLVKNIADSISNNSGINYLLIFAGVGIGGYFILRGFGSIIQRNRK